MKSYYKKIITFLILIFLMKLILNNKVFALNEVTSGECGNSVKWSLSSDGTLTISGSGAMSGSTCAWEDYKDEVKRVVFDGDITSISKCAFAYNTNLETITLPDSIKSIGERAFVECTNLREVNTTENLYKVSSGAFYRCYSLESIELMSEDPIYIKEYAFAECTSLKTITINSLSYIDNSVFSIDENAIICGYKYSNAYYYARYYGRKFKDMNTNEITTETFTNQDYLDALPTDINAVGVTSHNMSSWKDGTILRIYSKFL